MAKYTKKTAVKDMLEDIETKIKYDDTFSQKYMKYDSLYKSWEVKNEKKAKKMKLGSVGLHQTL